MKQALDVFHYTIYETCRHLGCLIWVTLLWWISVLPLVTIGPATAAMLSVIKQKRAGRSVRPSDYWRSFKKHWKVGVWLTLAYLFVAIPGILYTVLLIQSDVFLVMLSAVLLLYILMLWHMVYFYAFPILIEQQLTSVRLILLRSLKLVSENLVFSLNIALYGLVISLLCSIFTIAIVVWAGMIAVLASHATLNLLHRYEPEHYPFDYEVSWQQEMRPWKS